jgi:UDP-GlcNAc:undecaprenyl-phosphate GlcNAc-1-phosphate transferase
MVVANQLWVILGLGLALSLAVTPLFAWAAEKLGLVDLPAHRKIHFQPVPTMGGLPIFLALGLVLMFYDLFMKTGSGITSMPVFPMKLLVVYGAGFILALWGAVDDQHHLSSRSKFAGQFVIAFLFSLFCYRFEVFHIPGLPIYPMPDFLAVAVTVFWILAVINAFNMVDGVDGLACSVCVVSLFFVSATGAFFGNGGELGLALAALGVVLGFLFFNWKPAHIYLGDSGSSGLGMLVAGSLVALGHGTPLFQASPGAEPFQPFYYQILIVTLFIAYPVLEINLSVARRLFRGRPIYMADQGHIHHRLLLKGWTPVGIVVVAAAVSFFPGMSAFATLLGYKGLASWCLALSAMALGLGLPLLGFLDFLAPRFLINQRPHYRIAHHFTSMQRIKLALATTREEVLALVDQTCQELGVQACRLVIPADADKMGGLDYIYGFDPTRGDEMKAEVRGPVDRVRLFGGKGGAKWMFEHQQGEEELDMEYRVLTSEFMKEALQIAARLGRHLDTLELSSLAELPRHKITGLHLRRSHQESRDN